MMINNKFNGYSRDGVRLYFDPATIASLATMAEGAGVASSAAAAAAAAEAAAAAAAATAATTAAAPTMFETISGAMKAGTFPGATTAPVAETAANTIPMITAGVPPSTGPIPGSEGIMQTMPAGPQQFEVAGEVAPNVMPPDGMNQGIFADSTAMNANPYVGNTGAAPFSPDAGSLQNLSQMETQALQGGTGINYPVPQGGTLEAGAGGLDSLGAGIEKAMKFMTKNAPALSVGMQAVSMLGGQGGQKRSTFKPGYRLSPNFQPTLAPSAPSGVYSRGFAAGGIASDAEQPDYEDNISRFAVGGIAPGTQGAGTQASNFMANPTGVLTAILGREPTTSEVQAGLTATKAGQPLTAATIKANAPTATVNKGIATVPASQLTVAPSTAPTATVNVPKAATTVSPVATSAAKQVAASNPLMAAQTNPLMAAVNAGDTGSSGFNAMNYVSAAGTPIPWYQQTANVALPDAKKAAVIAGVTPGVAVKSQAEIDAAKPKTFDPANMPFNAMNYTDVKGAAIPWYQQTANVNLPDAKKAATIAGVTPGVAVKSQAEIDATKSQGSSGFNAMNYTDTSGAAIPWYQQAANVDLPDAKKAATIAGVTPGVAVKSQAELDAAEPITTTKPTTSGGIASGISREDAMEAMRRTVYVPEYVDYTRTPLTPGIGTPTTLSYDAIQSQLGHAPTLKEIGTASAAYEAAKPTTAAQYAAMAAKGEKGMAAGGSAEDKDSALQARYAKLQGVKTEQQTQSDLDDLIAYQKRMNEMGINTDDDVDTRMLDPYAAAQVRLAKVGKRNKVPVAEMPKTSVNLANMAQGGITQNLGGYSDGGHLLKGPGDGMSDHIPAMIGKRQPARLADGEFVIPADVVSHLGNGSTEAGAKQLYAMMSRIRKARTGNPKQGKQVDPRKLMPK